MKSTLVLALLMVAICISEGKFRPIFVNFLYGKAIFCGFKCESLILVTMKTTTASSQSPTPPSVGPSIVQIPSAAAVALQNQQTKNKRKNFNPRCSTSADENDMNASTAVDPILAVTTTTTPSTNPTPSSPIPSNPPSSTHQNASPTPLTIRNSPFKFDDPRIAFEAMSINWRKLLESQQSQHQSNEFRNFENNKFYNIPNTNFSIAKSAFGIAAAAAAAQQTPSAMASGEGSDPQSRIEFACNAFNAMQELLNVYGLSISPADIVDAFKKQVNAENAPLEPPTPPRTPIIASSDATQNHQRNATTPIDSTTPRTSSASEQHNIHQSPRSINNDGECAISSRPSSPWSSASQATASASISVASASKLMGNDSLNNADRRSRTSSTNDMTAREDNSDADRDDDDDDDEDNSSATHAFDLSYQYNDDSNGSASGEDQGSEGGTTINSFDLAMGRKDGFGDRSNDIFFSPLLQQSLQSEDKLYSADVSKYLKKYQSFLDCNNEQCIAENVREHYHCYDIVCRGKVLSKKEEISRHFKWHKKRNDSLTHGFLRFSSSDDCAPQFLNCSHNRKQTHYHCLQNNCDKVYISTSDVQMHSNYHRKDSAIYQEGFQRFRATEECNVSYCIFKGQRTTHFHCRRKNCKYTFKNKADMEKHKTFHIKDEQLARDGFKKFLKTEACPYEKCRFSRSGNHIHCVRENCYYVLHSSGQLISHKRKHDRMESEQAYRRFKIAQKLANSSNSALAVPGTGVSGGIASPDIKFPLLSSKIPNEYKSLLPGDLSVSLCTNKLSGIDVNAKDGDKSTLPVDILQQIHHQQQVHQQNMMLQMMGLDTARDKIRGTPLDRITNLPGRRSTDSLEEGIPKSIIPNAEFLDMKTTTSTDHIDYLTQTYFTDVCSMQNESNSGSKSPMNGPQERPLNLKSPRKTDVLDCFMNINEPHLHCLIKGCEMVIAKNGGDVTEHMRMHELARMGGASEEMLQIAPSVQITSIEGLFNRKRGRPPKNRVVEVYNNIQQSPQAIFTSFKLEKNDQSPLHTASQSKSISNDHPVEKSFRFFHRMERCDTIQCPYDKMLHFHCAVSDRCHFATNYPNVMDTHADEFHSNGATVPDGFEYYDATFDCQLYRCSYRKNSSHYHCIQCKETIKKIMDLGKHECHRPMINAHSNNYAHAAELKIMQNNNNENVNGNTAGAHHAHSDYDDGENVEMNAGELSGNLTDSCGSDKMNVSEGKVSGSQVDDKDKVSVVRAAGTYFPQNSDNEQVTTPTKPSASPTTSIGDTSPESTCTRPFCKLKKKVHDHCDLCNQAFSDAMKLKIHYLKHQSSKLGHSLDHLSENSKSANNKEASQSTTTEPTSKLLHPDSEPEDLTKSSANKSTPSTNQPSNPSLMSPSNFADNFSSSLQNFHLAQLALYQQHPFYYHHLYPLLTGQGVPPPLASDILQQHIEQQQKHQPSTSASKLSTAQQLLKLESAQAAAAASIYPFAGMPSTTASMKRKLEETLLSPTLTSEGGGSAMSYMAKKMPKLKQANFKMFKDEPIPTGYLKFRFNEDCNFANCGYRNHQSHFHCCRNDCFYSFCDKTRFVQHTARHERLDKLMGDDFKQYRANMRCGYDQCAYNKNMGHNNKSSHFHCMKCNFICSDTNKVVAHRRQHSKLEYIRDAGFRKVANNERCTSGELDAQSGECSYSMKQTHYHCLQCGSSVLSRAQLGSHRHRM